MNDTVMKLLSLADEYAAARYEQGYARVYTNGDVIGTRQALQDELVRLFTPLEADEIRDHIRGMDVDTREDLCAFSFRTGARWAERKHGITGESK